MNFNFFKNVSSPLEVACFQKKEHKGISLRKLIDSLVKVRKNMYVLANSFSLPKTIGKISESVLTTRWAELTG